MRQGPHPEAVAFSFLSKLIPFLLIFRPYAVRPDVRDFAKREVGSRLAIAGEEARLHIDEFRDEPAVGFGIDVDFGCFRHWVSLGDLGLPALDESAGFACQ